jgi:hypothetical protein
VAQSSIMSIPKKLAAWGILGVALAGVWQSLIQPSPSQAQILSRADLAATDMPESPAAESIPPAELSSYTYSNLFSVGLPAGWQITEQEASPQVLATNVGNDSATASATPTAIRTEITWFNEPPDTVVPEALQAIEANGYTVDRYDASQIDGTTALQIWLVDLPQGLPNAYITYIGYDETTAAIVSYYNESLPAVDELVGAIHESFQRLP